MTPFLALLLVGPRPLTDARLTVEGDVVRKKAYTAEDLRRIFSDDLKDVSFTEKGVAGHAHAFPLVELVKAAEPKIDPKRKNAEFSLAVVAIAADGYSAVFSGAELSTVIGKGEVWVALDWNDKPLNVDDAPIRLIVPGDAKPARWVHGVRTLRIVNLAPKK